MNGENRFMAGSSGTPHWLTHEEVDALPDFPEERDADNVRIRKYGDSWYFWDESDSQCFGPLPNIDVARHRFEMYTEYVAGRTVG